MQKLNPDQAERFHLFFINWFDNQKAYSLPTLSEKVGMPYKTVYSYYKKKTTPSLERANVIIDFIKNEKKNEPTNKDDNKKAIVVASQNKFDRDILERYTRQMKSVIDSLESEINFKEKKDNNSDELSVHLSNLNNSVYDLYIELEWFKNKTNKEREAFRKNISPNDIGYITTLIRAIAKGEDTLNDWVMNSSYNLEMLKWQKRH